MSGCEARTHLGLAAGGAWARDDGHARELQALLLINTIMRCARLLLFLQLCLAAGASLARLPASGRRLEGRHGDEHVLDEAAVWAALVGCTCADERRAGGVRVCAGAAAERAWACRDGEAVRV